MSVTLHLTGFEGCDAQAHAYSVIWVEICVGWCFLVGACVFWLLCCGSFTAATFAFTEIGPFFGPCINGGPSREAFAGQNRGPAL